MKFKTAGDKNFTEDGRIAKITVDLLLTAGARMAEEKSRWSRRRHRRGDDEGALHKRKFTELRRASNPSSWR